MSGNEATFRGYQLDAALARPVRNNSTDAHILGFGRPTGSGNVYLGQLVQKSGRTTAVTRGRIALVETTVNVGFSDGRLARFTGQVATSPMGEPGDSGSLLLDGARQAVGLLFAGSRRATLFHPVKPVLDALNVVLDPYGTTAVEEEEELPELRKLCQRQADSLLALPNVVGVGIGYKQVRGLETGDPSLVVMVSRKMDRSLLREKDLVPSRVEGVLTDVLETGKFEATTEGSWYSAPVNRRARIRPARPGCSIGHYLVSAGTFGAVVYDRNSGEPLILSNNHVLANGSDGSDSLSRPADPILQPGRTDGGRNPQDIIARLLRFTPISFLPKP